MEEKAAEERRMEEKIKRQVAEGVRRLIDEERVEEILAESSRTGSERLRRRLQRNRSDKSAASNVSSVAKESEPASERRTESASVSCPELVFAQNAAGLFVSPGVAKYHFSLQCRGLRHATEVKELPRCANCGLVQVKPKLTLFCSYRCEVHTIRGHAAVKREYSAFEPCHICAKH